MPLHCLKYPASALGVQTGLAAGTLVCRLRMKTFVGASRLQVYVGGNGWDAGTIPPTLNPLGRNKAVFCNA